jgi:glycosyltransferase involved in cell wall biosynthesis
MGLSDFGLGMAKDGLIIDGVDCRELGLKAPLVSVVIPNWNYARFVGAAIDSIRAQDYPHFECLIIDNGSTDDSRAVIARHISGDPRFSVLFLDKNYGIMGAWQEGLNRVKGEFITFHDSDDIKFPNFISSHVQVHLATRLGIGFTSSRVVEIDVDDRVINGSSLGFGFNPFDQEPRGLKPREVVPRLATISDAEYEILDNCTRVLGPEKTGWFWSPTSANVYRRGVMELARPIIDPSNNFIAGDIHFCVLCHILGGSAVIDRTLSAYRIHGESVSNELPSMAQMRGSKKQTAMDAVRGRQFMLLTLLARADRLSWVIKDRYWQAVDQQSGETGNSLEAYYTNSEIQLIFAEYFIALIDVFGVQVVTDELGRRLPSADSRFVILERLLSHAPSIVSSIDADVFWRMVDWCVPNNEDIRRYYSRPAVAALFVQYYDCLVTAYGEPRLVRELRRRYHTKSWCTIIWQARRGWQFPRTAIEIIQSEIMRSAGRFLSKVRLN